MRAELQRGARSNLALILVKQVDLCVHVALWQGQGRARQILMRVIQVKDLVAETLLG